MTIQQEHCYTLLCKKNLPLLSPTNTHWEGSQISLFTSCHLFDPPIFLALLNEAVKAFSFPLLLQITRLLSLNQELQLSSKVIKSPISASSLLSIWISILSVWESDEAATGKSCLPYLLPVYHTHFFHSFIVIYKCRDQYGTFQERNKPFIKKKGKMQYRTTQ